MSNTITFDCRSFESVTSFDGACDVIVCGFGGAGGAAALEAKKAGADVIVFERASGAGGSTAMSSCEMYLGGSGGTALQKDLGFDDSTENMVSYLEEAFGVRGCPEKIRCYAQGAAEHFDWVESLGVYYKRAVFLERDVVPLSDESLLFTGNERAHPFNKLSEPVPRGHVPSKEGDEGGKIFMDSLIAAVEKSGVNVQCDSRVIALLKDRQQVVRGVVVKQDNQERFYKANKGVVLSSGGFVMNPEMTRRYMPEVHEWGVPYGNPFDMGDGIQLGMNAGAALANMDEAFVALPLYPPAKLTFGIFVNEQAQRFINEDAYLARLAHYASIQSQQKLFLLISNEDYEASMYIERLPVVAVGDSIEEVEQEAGMPQGALQNTVNFYNENAEKGEDPLFHKAKEWLKPIKKGPFALVNYSFDELRAVIMPGTVGPLIFTLGGLETKNTGEVLDGNGDVIKGLYAAGRVSAGLPRTCKGYSSGMSVGDATFFGRKAGKQAASNSLC